MMRAVTEAPPLGISAPRSTVWAPAAETVKKSAIAAIVARFIAPPGFG